MKYNINKILTFAIMFSLLTSISLAQGTSGIGPNEQGAINFENVNLNQGFGGNAEINSISSIFIFILGLLRWLGWIGVILGVCIILFALIYKLIGAQSEEAQAAVQGAITKAVIIVIAGILLLSVGFIVNQIGNLFGLNLEVNDVLGGSTPQTDQNQTDQNQAVPNDPNILLPNDPVDTNPTQQ